MPIEISPSKLENYVNRQVVLHICNEQRNHSHKCNVSQYRSANVVTKCLSHRAPKSLPYMRYGNCALSGCLQEKSAKLSKNNFLKSQMMLCLSKRLFSFCTTKLRLQFYLLRFCRNNSSFSVLSGWHRLAKWISFQRTKRTLVKESAPLYTRWVI